MDNITNNNEKDDKYNNSKNKFVYKQNPIALSIAFNVITPFAITEGYGLLNFKHLYKKS